MRVGVFGAYTEGNFGDDLMAFMFARRIKELGHQPVIFGIPGDLALKYGHEACGDLDTFLEKIDCLVYGGGGILTIERVIHNYQRVFMGRIDKIMSHQRTRGLPIGFFSIGGNGWGHTPVKRVLDFIRCATNGFVSVRLQSDFEYLTSCGIKCRYYPDVVLSAIYEIDQVCPSERNVLALSIHKRLGRIFFPVIWALSFFSGRKIVFVKTHREGSPYNYEFLPFRQSKRIFSHVINDPISSLTQMHDWKFVVSPKLHLGVAALSCGAVFYGNEGKNKVKCFAESAGIENFLFKNKLQMMFKIFRLIFKDDPWEKIDLSRFIEGSLRHFDELSLFLKFVSNTRTSQGPLSGV